MNNIFKLNDNLIKINDDYYCVTNDLIVIGDYACLKNQKYADNNNLIVKCTDDNIFSIQEHWRKIIYSTKFIDESIPVLDINLNNENDIVKYSIDATKDKLFAHGLHEEVVAQIYFRRGYKKAKEKFMYTEENLKMIAKWAFELYRTNDSDEEIEQFYNNTLPKLIKSFIEPKEIKSIEVDYELVNSIGKTSENYTDIALFEESLNKFDVYLRPIFLSNGKVKCNVEL